MVDNEDEIKEDAFTSNPIVTSDSIDQGMVKTDIDKTKTLDEGFVNVAVDIDKYFGLTKDMTSQYQREVANEEATEAALTLQQLKIALHMNEAVLVERYTVEDKPLTEYAGALKASKLVEGKLTEDILTHLSGKLFTEMVFSKLTEACNDNYEKVCKAVEAIGITDFSVESVLKNMLEAGDL